ncbi:DNA topoisomerase I [Marine Group I thaumarchaeote]|jgi:DNA topoisomerase-1|uniref:DNA topoisomerase 1 n=1 Tax=Marine Group I thaumarchaeote TaxID=2511932 RepID=A0A7K4N4V2_9ARCH|nr:MAG: DNA topoisomerase I [Nitrosopumilus sp. YT1]NMI81754.1 DNA topoisomerase I [Candidatus Nitrosopumilus sp. MTA1]NWJ19692.1 DNA topoisomerase I [Marine Group I thaumarchaeote]NWJ83461.1 DNA topoisomerase I [Marine Group I thaumarchaeote]NWK07413.1 DNA topoisomerase I [Marine Group I thaumarchaeote]
MKWETLQHNGILFPPAYETQGVKIKIKGESVDLDLNQEEMIYQWAKKKDTPYAQDKVFQKNFTADFAKTLNSKFKKISYKDIDFSNAYKVVDKEKDLKNMMTKEEKKSLAVKRKELRENLKTKYGIAIMDGKEVEVGNYMAEPPGIFIGRGEHPIRGKWKSRVSAKDVTLNLGKEAKVPEGEWGKIIHDKNSMWLASWMDFLTQKRKYVWLADSSGLKQDRDKAKYEKAVKLAKEIDKIKDRIVKDMKSKEPKISRIATACYLIYRTSMRVGDEKDPDEADTVGATTLRKEHIKITADAIEFDFLGKDSVRWQETIIVEGHDKQFQKNLKKLIEKKNPKDEIFNDITSRHVNAYYSSIVKGLTAKVFRTYLATAVVKNYLVEHDNIKGKTANEKLYHAKMANLEAAKMCNHKRTIPKTFDQVLEKKRDTIKNAEKDQPSKKTQETLKKVESSQPKTETQKKNKEKRIKTLNEQIKKQKQKHRERVEKLKLQIDLSEKTRDYNLGTSLRNYIDPRVIKAWTDEVGVEWEKLYTAALQKKFLWVKNENTE